MKVLDGEGRLFGKINIVDFGIILLLTIAIPAFFHMYTILGKRPTKVPHEWIRVKAVAFTIPEIAELFKEGDTSYDEIGEPDGKLLRIIGKGSAYSGKFKSAIIDKSDASKHKNNVPAILEFKLSCEYSITGGHWYYKRNHLLVGMDNPFVFACKKYHIICYAVKIEG